MTDTTTQDLKDAENALRDLIYAKLISTFGKDWPKECSVTQERIKVWEKRKEEERKKISAIDERLLYYADFHDLQTILHKNWDSMFREIFIDKKRLEAYLSILEDYRNPEAHRRELFPHQKQLVSGASGEIRSLIVRWRSKKEGADDFKRMEKELIEKSDHVLDLLIENNMLLEVTRARDLAKIFVKKI